MKILDKIVITTVPKIGSSGCTPYVEVLCGKDFTLIWSNKHSQNLKHYKVSSTQVHLPKKIIIDIDKDPLLCGDIYFKIMHKGSLKNKLICRFALNTSFIKDNYQDFTKATVDPDAVFKDNRFSDEFKVELYFKDVCQRCSPQLPLEHLCVKCV